MGTLRTKNANQQLLHTSIAIALSRVNLGVVAGSMWQRDDASTGASRDSKHLEGKESQRWINHYQYASDVQAHSPDTTVVSVAD